MVGTSGVQDQLHKWDAPHRSPTDSPDFIELSDIFSIFSMKQYEAVMKWPRNWGPRRLQVLPSPPVLNTPDPWMDSFVHRPGPFAAELRTTLAAATPSLVLQMLGVASEGVRVLGFRGMGNYELGLAIPVYFKMCIGGC